MTRRIRTPRFRRSSRCCRRRARPTSWWCCSTTRGSGRPSTFGGPINTPNFDRLAAGGLRFNRFHTTALCSPTRQALLTGRNHHSVGNGGHHRDRHLGSRLQLGAAEGQGAAGRDPQAQRLLHRPVRQVPRGAGLADQPDRAVRRLAHRRRWLRALLRLHRRRDEPVGRRRSTGTPCRSSRSESTARSTTSPRT